MSKLSLRVVVRFAVFFTLLLALSLSQGWAGTIQGSSTTARSFTDVATGQVFIYNGGFFVSGETVNTFNWFGPTFSGSRDLTPLLFSESNGVFTVVGIGTSQTITDPTAGVMSVAFGLEPGGTNLTGSNFTFGFVNGLTDSTGTLSSTSAGTVEHNNTVDAGTGVGGLGTTNDWVFTPSESGINVALGTTFQIPGSNGTTGSSNFLLNNPGLGGNNGDRTYSANADGVISGVAEPGTFSLITGAGLVLAGLFRYRHSRGRRNS